jgi:tripartite ATP-independent transporter DctP family solute receptor
MPARIARRSFVAGAALGPAAVFVRSLRAADYSFVQFHNQTATSSLHRRLVEMWAAVRTETNGRVDTQVLAQNNRIAGSDPEALRMLVAGEIQFFTLMGGVLGNVVAVAEVQQVPFSFRSAAHAHSAMDGPLGAYLRDEMATRGILGFPVGAFDNGMRQIAGNTRPIVRPADLVGVRMRVPATAIMADMFRALGADPITINSDRIYEALKAGTVDAQENPLALVELFKISEVVKYVSMTNHMWSGFNMLGHLPTWKRLPGDITAIIERSVARSVRLQRRDQEQMNAGLRSTLERRGLVFNDVDPAPFRAKLADFYGAWKQRLGTRCWSLLEETTGRLG